MTTRRLLVIVVLILSLCLALPTVVLAQSPGPPPGVPTLPDFLASLQTPAGLAAAVWITLEIAKRQMSKEQFDRWGLALAVGFSVAIPLAALLFSALLGLAIVTPDTIYYAIAAAFLVSQGYFGITNGISKAVRTRESP